MLTDVALKSLRLKEKPYKVTDRDGMYVHVSSGRIHLSGWSGGTSDRNIISSGSQQAIARPESFASCASIEAASFAPHGELAPGCTSCNG